MYVIVHVCINVCTQVIHHRCRKIENTDKGIKSIHNPTTRHNSENFHVHSCRLEAKHVDRNNRPF